MAFRRRAFRRFRHKRRGGFKKTVGGLQGVSRGGRLSAAVRSEVLRISAFDCKKLKKTDPPQFMPAAPVRRVVRVQIDDTQTTVGVRQIASTEYGYYISGGTAQSSRWRKIRVLSCRAYSVENINAINVSVPTEQGGTAQQQFTDHGDLNHRAALMITWPASHNSYALGSGASDSPVIEFQAATIDIVDFYCEFN